MTSGVVPATQSDTAVVRGDAEGKLGSADLSPKTEHYLANFKCLIQRKIHIDLKAFKIHL